MGEINQPGNEFSAFRNDILHLRNRVDALEGTIGDLSKQVAALDDRLTSHEENHQVAGDGTDDSTLDPGVHGELISPSRLRVTWKPVQGLGKECGVYLQRKTGLLRFWPLEPVTMKGEIATAEFDLGILTSVALAISHGQWQLIYTDSSGNPVPVDVKQ